MLNDLTKIKDLEGVDFITGIKKLLEKHLTQQELQRLNTIPGTRLACSLVSKTPY